MRSYKADPIKVLHLISTLDVGGGEQNLCSLVSKMDQTVFKNKVISMTGIGPIGRQIEDNGVEVHALSMKKGFPDPRGLLHLYHLVHGFRPDIVHCWMYHANLLGLFVMSNRPLVWGILCSYMDLSKYGVIYKLTLQAGAFFSRLPHVVVANSHAGRKVHTGLGYKPKRWEIIPNGFETDIFKPDHKARTDIRSKLNIPPEAIVIGLIARLDPMKDHQTFLKAARMLLSARPESHFILAGRGVTADTPIIQQMIREIPHKANLHFLGERSDIPQVIASMDISTSSSYGEGFSNTIGESMAAGVPCVVTDVGDSNTLIGETGIVVPEKNPAALYAAWESLISAGPDFLRSLGEHARNRIIEHYSMASFVKRYESLYTSLINGLENRRIP